MNADKLRRAVALQREIEALKPGIEQWDECETLFDMGEAWLPDELTQHCKEFTEAKAAFQGKVSQMLRKLLDSAETEFSAL